MVFGYHSKIILIDFVIFFSLIDAVNTNVSPTILYMGAMIVLISFLLSTYEQQFVVGTNCSFQFVIGGKLT
jgi:hypothetical protein